MARGTEHAGTNRSCPVREAQERVIREGLAKPGPDTDILPKTSQHFVGDDLWRHGEMWVATIEREIYKKER